jgi:hypothetical protein
MSTRHGGRTARNNDDYDKPPGRKAGSTQVEGGLDARVKELMRLLPSATAPTLKERAPVKFRVVCVDCGYVPRARNTASHFLDLRNDGYHCINRKHDTQED